MPTPGTSGGGRPDEERNDISEPSERGCSDESGRNLSSHEETAALSSQVHLRHALPPESVMVVFLQEYFESVHWFSLVIYEPTFRPRFDAVRTGSAHPSQRSFLLLLSVILGLGAWYRGHRRDSLEQPSNVDSKTWSHKLIANAESQIIELLDSTSITAVQTLTLLGSFFVYHGRPNLSFSLLGATIKTAYTAGLHKTPSTSDLSEAEERKRLWWTIYTWDRFASITYGRPMSIDESDFRVAMPEDIAEMVNFQSNDSSDAVWVCFSTYQRELNKLYMIASPAIKQVYGANEAADLGRAQVYSALLEEVTARLWHWHQELPDELSLDLSRDSPAALSTASRAHYLQSLALQLTFDSLLIILYRPSLRGQMSALQSHGIGRDHGLGISALRSPRSQSGAPSRAPSEETTLPPTEISQQQWWKAASRTATVARLPRLADIACDGHLVAFLAINLFNAAVVMVVLALSDPLSDRAQEAKRAIAWIYRLLGVLGTRASPSKQSVAVLRSLITLLSRRESEAILAFDPPEGMGATGGQQEDSDVLAQMRQVSALPSRSTNARMSTNGSRTYDDTNSYSTSRINDSLASVQKAFHVRSTPFPQPVSDRTSDSMAFTPDSGAIFGDPTIRDMDFLSHSDIGASTVSSDWSTGLADGGNGVYWFWDASWDNLYNSGDVPPSVAQPDSLTANPRLQAVLNSLNGTNILRALSAPPTRHRRCQSLD